MNTNEYFKRIKQIDCLIRLRATGTPEQCACKLNISKRTLYNYINEMREMGMPISFSRELQSYIYTTEGGFMAGFKALTELEKV
jgi:predicted DNA-binding transcriptional regulator YafY